MTDDAKPKLGRPLREYTPEQIATIKAAASIMCTDREIASLTGIPLRTLEEHFRAEIDKNKETGKMSLRRRQWKTADEGNPALQIWLGKQWLGQVDKKEVELSSDPDKPVVVQHQDDITAALAGLNDEERRKALRKMMGIE
jgi:hypothetical protein